MHRVRADTHLQFFSKVGGWGASAKFVSAQRESGYHYSWEKENINSHLYPKIINC